MPRASRDGRSSAISRTTRHKRLRAKLAPIVARGDAVCARCGRPIQPGQPWDLGHVDGGGPYQYSGPEHRRCNRATAGRTNGRANGRATHVAAPGAGERDNRTLGDIPPAERVQAGRWSRSW